MYLNTHRHFLSNSICLSAIIGLSAQVLNALFRVIFNSRLSEPDMLNSYVFVCNTLVQVTVIVLIALIFYFNHRQMKHVINVVDADDSDEMAILQKEFIPEKISTLKAATIYQLLEIWAIILIFTHIISMVSNYQYRAFVNNLYQVISVHNYEDALGFANIYNLTHGFKYIGMFSAIIIGIFVTAVFLKDRLLKIISFLLTVLFILAFTIFQMVTFYTEIKIISIVWTSVIYHGLETVGLMLFSVYLSKHYRGL